MYAEVYMHIGGLILKVISKIRLDLYIKTILDVQARRCFLLYNGFFPKKLVNAIARCSLGVADTTSRQGKRLHHLPYGAPPPPSTSDAYRDDDNRNECKPKAYDG